MSDHYTPSDLTEDEAHSSHSYDGIQEYDNPTPGWWNWLFFATTIFAPIYILWFHSPVEERNLAAQYGKAFAANLTLQFGEIGELEPTRETLLEYIDDEKWLAVGTATFATHCASCHGREAEGVSAPNLTDEYYLHVKQIEDIARVVTNGARNGAMPAWGNRLHPNEVVLVSAYVASLRGKNIDSTRKPEGDTIEPWLKPTGGGERATDKAPDAAEAQNTDSK